jgi:cell division protein YceG involved in septum cleavage
MTAQKATPKKRRYLTWLRVFVFLLLIKATLLTAGLMMVLSTKNAVFTEVAETIELNEIPESAPAPFPLSVNPGTKTITEDPTVNTFLDTYLAYEAVRPVRQSWWHQITRSLSRHGWYQSLASPITRILVIWPGDRKEEVVAAFSSILGWNDDERTRFAELITTSSPTLPDGTFFPGRYVTDKDATPEAVAQLLLERFTTEVQARYPEDIERIVPLKDALIVASLLEREAYEFSQMREISGVIWNRLFTGMPLQLDATLQYAKGSQSGVRDWWPLVRPDDKYIDSPYNTYQNEGLPPAPIANPSAAAILAALNPTETDCFFYFHDNDGSMYCSSSYEEHVAKLRELYGQGQ